jgi:hypothetical protein
MALRDARNGCSAFVKQKGSGSAAARESVTPGAVTLARRDRST